MSLNMKSIMGKALLTICSIVVTFLVVEGGVRLWGIRPYSDRLVAYEFDEELGWRTRNNFRYFRSTVNYAHFNYYNPNGFPTSQKHWHDSLDSSKSSIAFIGDSFTEGYYLPYEFTFSNIVGEQLPNMQIINLGVSGYAPDQYLLAARRHLPRYKVQAIVVMFFANNDIPDIQRSEYQGYAKPIFGDSLEKPLNTPLQKLGGKKTDRSFPQMIVDQLALYTLMRPVIKQYLAASADQEVDTPLEYSEASMRRALRFIRQIHREFPESQFIVFYVPRYEELTTPGIFERNVSLFRKIARDLDLSIAVSFDRSVTGSPRSLYISGDGHVSRHGSALIAQILLPYLKSQ